MPPPGLTDRCISASARSSRAMCSMTSHAAMTSNSDSNGIRVASICRSAAPGRREGSSIVGPVYSREASLELLVERLLSVLPSMAGEFEIILVNDGSRDGSWDVAAQLARSTPRVRAVNLLRNFGQHNALLAGIRA